MSSSACVAPTSPYGGRRGAFAAALVSVVTTLSLVALQACGGSPVAPSKNSEPGCSGAEPIAEPCQEQYSDASYWPQFDALPCPPRAAIEQIRQEIPVTIKSDSSAGMLACRAEDGSADLTPAQFELYQALLFLRRLDFDAPLPWTEQTVYAWLRSAIPAGIVLDSSGNSSSCLNCPGPITIALHASHWSRWDRSITGMPYEGIVHEARHADGWGHTCRYNTSWSFTRDRTVSEMGAYGVQYYLNLWLARHSAEPETFKKYSLRRSAELREAFCCECAGAAPGPPSVRGLSGRTGIVARCGSLVHRASGIPDGQS